MRLSVLLFFTLLSIPTLVLADTPLDVDALSQTPQGLLEALDKRHNAYDSQKWTFEMTVIPVSGSKRSMKFDVMQKGSKRLVRFLSPGDVKGMSVLSKGRTMYVYAPQTENVRRVATSARRQNLLGSNFTYADMATVNLAPEYNATVGAAADDHVWLELNKKAESDAAWPKLRLRINKKHALIEVVEYWDAGKKVKTQHRTNFTVVGGAPTWKTIIMSSEGGLKTRLEMLSQKINEPIPNKVFSKRSLVRGQ
ncbi:MAG: outer membrane lipoprotein-sorting protein [Myxococcota bacterium]|nr:outer membrane lipoprotein-sorting protein [Myxococcota bacterium]